MDHLDPGAPNHLAPCLTRTDVARYLRVSPRTVDRMREAGQLAYFKVGRQVRFRPADVLALCPGAVEDQLTQHIAKLVEGAPPLSDAQIERITTLLRAGAA
ncbi:MAG: helix-turn-helix domain-containing protein [Mycobacterium sp.]|nr:helix-turn-helix domain-containing protein [Mycobacterium sp.]